MKTRIKTSGFTLVELLVSMTILSVLLLLLTSLLGNVQRAWVSAQDQVGQFREARVAFDIITKNVSQASLHTYWDYHYDTNNNPDGYERRSELHFRTFRASELQGQVTGTTVGHALFFQAPLGSSVRYRNLHNLFNGRGYFVVYGDDLNFRPNFVKTSPKQRFRLMEFRPPAEENQVFADSLAERNLDAPVNFDTWWKQSEPSVVSGAFSTHIHPLAENIITLIVSPRDSIEKSGDNRRNTYSEIAATYSFDSNVHSNPKYVQQIPPLVRITMVAIDETAGIRTEDSGKALSLVPATLFRNTNKYDDDIKKLGEDLSKKGINYRVFSTMVMLRSSRWST